MGTMNLRGGSTSSMAEVDANRLRTRPLSEWDVAKAAGLAFSWSSASHNYAQYDTIIAVENNSEKYDLKIKKIVIISDTATEFIVFAANGVTIGAGDAIAGVNLNRDSAQLATTLATAMGDEQGQDEQGDTYPGKLITGRVVADVASTLDVDGAIVLPNDHMIGLDFTTVGTDSYATVWGYFVPR